MPKLSWLKGRVMARLLLLLIPFTIVSCKEDLVQDDKLSNKDNVMVVQAPNDHYNPYVNIKSNDYNVSNRYSKCTFNETTTYSNVYAKQDGQIVDCGQCSATLDSDRKKLTVKYNEKGLINTTKEHTVYFSQRALTIKDNVPYVKSELNRTGSFYTVGKASLKSSGATVQGKENGVNEIAYIVNRTNSPIKFKHKGFSADELWYYNSAEISLDNMQTVVNGEAVKTDVESEVKEIPLLSNNQMGVIYSHYPPNGKKIKNATLIAEIDGKEVRTSNTLSSNLDIVSGNAYCYVLEWDGKELRFAEDVTVGNIIDLSNPEQSGIEIDNIDEDYTIGLFATEETAPKVGDLLCSGPCEMAPYGFALKVESVTKNDGRRKVLTRGVGDYWNAFYYVVKASAVSAEAIWEYFTEDYSNWFYFDTKDLKVSKIVDEEGNEMTFEEEGKGWTLSTTLKEGGMTITPTVNLLCKRFGVYLHIKDQSLAKFGVDTGFKTNISINIKGESKQSFKKKIPIKYIEFSPIDIQAGPVPLVFTPLLYFYIDTELSGKLSMNYTYKYDTYVRAGTVYNFNTEVYEFIPGMNDFFQFEDCVFNPDIDLGYTVSLSGAAEFSPGVSYSFGFYGCNYFERMESKDSYDDSQEGMTDKDNTDDDIPGWFKKYLGDIICLDLYADYVNRLEASIDVRPFVNQLNDKCTMKSEVRAHAQLNAFGWHPELKTPAWRPFIEDPSVISTFLFSDIKDMSFELQQDDLQVKATKTQPLMNYCGYDELKFGFCIAPVTGIETSDQEKKYQYYDITNQYPSSYLHLLSHDVICRIPKKDLVAGKTYELRPYVIVRIFGGEYLVYRDSKTFRYDSNGKISNVTIDNVPGENL